jgi:hypothetical protein
MTPTDDEVLELAEKIKKQRVVDEEYAGAAIKLLRLQSNISNSNSDEKVYEVKLNFKVNSINYWAELSEQFTLPAEMVDDLIQFIQNYIAKKQITNN